MGIGEYTSLGPVAPGDSFIPFPSPIRSLPSPIRSALSIHSIPVPGSLGLSPYRSFTLTHQPPGTVLPVPPNRPFTHRSYTPACPLRSTHLRSLHYVPMRPCTHSRSLGSLYSLCSLHYAQSLTIPPLCGLVHVSTHRVDEAWDSMEWNERRHGANGTEYGPRLGLHYAPTHPVPALPVRSTSFHSPTGRSLPAHHSLCSLWALTFAPLPFTSAPTQCSLSSITHTMCSLRPQEATWRIMLSERLVSEG